MGADAEQALHCRPWGTAGEWRPRHRGAEGWAQTMLLPGATEPAFFFCLCGGPSCELRQLGCLRTHSLTCFQGPEGTETP